MKVMKEHEIKVRNPKDYAVLMKHIRRLQRRNVLLADCLAQERNLRICEAQNYQKILLSPFRRFQHQIVASIMEIASKNNSSTNRK